MEDFSLKSLKKRYIFALFISPIILISIISLVVKYGTIIINTKELFIDISSPVKLGDYLSYYFSIIGIELTALLSVAVWRTAVKSNNLAKAINDKEENRDKEKVRESALIVYYDLIYKISMLKLLYSKIVLKQNVQEARKISLTSDWVKNVANLRNILNGKELEKVFELYSSFLSIHELDDGDNDGDNDMKVIVEGMANKVFIPALKEYLWMDFTGENEAVINSEYYLILRKIEATANNELTYCSINPKGKTEVKQGNGNIKYIGQFDNGMLKSGTDKWTSDDGKAIYSFEYEDYKIVEGMYSNKIDGDFKLIFNCKFDTEGKQTSGVTTIFHENNKVRYHGEFIDNHFNGEGKLYSKTNSLIPQFSGLWKNGLRVSGVFKDKGSKTVKYFKGEYKNNQPFTGEIEVDELHEFNGAYGFRGTIYEGKPANGHGYKLNNKLYNDSFIEEHPEFLYDDEDDNDYDYDDYPCNEIPDEVQQEMREDSIRMDNEALCQNYMEKNGNATELIEAKWVDGTCEKSPDDSLYKKYFTTIYKK